MLLHSFCCGWRELYQCFLGPVNSPARCLTLEMMVARGDSTRAGWFLDAEAQDQGCLSEVDL